MTSLFIFDHKSIDITFAIVLLVEYQTVLQELGLKTCNKFAKCNNHTHLIIHCVIVLLNIQSTNAPGNFHPTTTMTYFRRFSSYGFSIYFPDRLLSMKCIFCNITTYVNFIVLYEQVKKDKTRPYGKCRHKLTVFCYVYTQYIYEINSKLYLDCSDA